MDNCIWLVELYNHETDFIWFLFSDCSFSHHFLLVLGRCIIVWVSCKRMKNLKSTSYLASASFFLFSADHRSMSTCLFSGVWLLGICSYRWKRSSMFPALRYSCFGSFLWHNCFILSCLISEIIGFFQNSTLFAIKAPRASNIEVPFPHQVNIICSCSWCMRGIV